MSEVTKQQQVGVVANPAADGPVMSLEFVHPSGGHVRVDVPFAVFEKIFCLSAYIHDLEEEGASITYEKLDLWPAIYYDTRLPFASGFRICIRSSNSFLIVVENFCTSTKITATLDRSDVSRAFEIAKNWNDIHCLECKQLIVAGAMFCDACDEGQVAA